MKSETRWSLCVAALIVIAVLRIAATYNSLSVTTDEGAHLACGMQWLDRGSYTYEYQHPPLARVTLAVVPFLMGARNMGQSNMWADGWAILYADGVGRARLAQARMGTLPFLVLGAIVVWLWGKRWFGNGAGLTAAALFTTIPPILAHAGLATLDMASSATCALALYQLIRWREDPTMRRAAMLGVAIAIALLCKFSFPAFFLASVILGMFGWRGAGAPIRFTTLLKQGAAVAGIVFFMVWAMYRFKVQPILDPSENHQAIPQVMGRVFGNQPALFKAISWTLDVPTPLGGLFRGFAEIVNHDALGHLSFFLGQTHHFGVWYYFPVVLAVKTPVGFLLLAAIGIWMAFRRRERTPWQHRVTALFACAILLVCMTSRINRGVRHVLAIYPPLAVLAGNAAVTLAARRKTSWIPVGTIGWVVIASFIAHPDYLPYFNEFASSHPEKIVVDSDLDWGQDLYRLSARLREMQIDHIGIKYWGGSLIEHAGLPPYTVIQPNEITEGWVAISIHDLYTYHARDGSWAWLYDRQPIEKIGHSILLYHIEKY